MKIQYNISLFLFRMDLKIQLRNSLRKAKYVNGFQITNNIEIVILQGYSKSTYYITT